MRPLTGRPAAAAAVLAGLLVATACSAAPAAPRDPAGQAVPSGLSRSVPAPGPAAPASTDPAPRVAAPRDPARLAACHPSTELLGAGLVDPATAGPTTGAAGAGCSWAGPGRAFLLRADVRAAGLDAMYRTRDAFRAFRTGELDGLPTVVTTPEGDPSCSLHVATSDRDSLTVQAGPAGAAVPDPCATAARAASRLLAALPAR